MQVVHLHAKITKHYIIHAFFVSLFPTRDLAPGGGAYYAVGGEAVRLLEGADGGVGVVAEDSVDRQREPVRAEVVGRLQ